MTHTQEMMLAICCGVSVGSLVGQFITAVVQGILLIRDKRREKKAAKGNNE